MSFNIYLRDRNNPLMSQLKQGESSNKRDLGIWSEKEAEDFLKTISDFEKIDEELWK